MGTQAGAKYRAVTGYQPGKPSVGESLIAMFLIPPPRKPGENGGLDWHEEGDVPAHGQFAIKPEGAKGYVNFHVHGGKEDVLLCAASGRPNPWLVGIKEKVLPDGRVFLEVSLHAADPYTMPTHTLEVFTLSADWSTDAVWTGLGEYTTVDMGNAGIRLSPLVR